MIQNTGVIKEKKKTKWLCIQDCNLILKQFSTLQCELEFLVRYFGVCLRGLESDEGRPESFLFWVQKQPCRNTKTVIPPWYQTLIIFLPKFKVKSWPLAQANVDLNSIKISVFTITYASDNIFLWKYFFFLPNISQPTDD